MVLPRLSPRGDAGRCCRPLCAALGPRGDAKTMRLLRAEARRRYLRPHHAREDAGSGQRYIGGKALVCVTRGRAVYPQKMEKPAFACITRGRMPEAANDTLEEKPSFALRVGERYIPQKMEKPAFACITRGRMPEAASDTLAENPLSASRGRGRYILKKTGQPALVRVTYGRVPEAASAPSAENPSFASREGRWDILKRRRSLPFLRRVRKDAGSGQRYIGGKALVRVTRRRALHP